MTIELTLQEEYALLELLAPLVTTEPTEAQQSLYDKVYSGHDKKICPTCDHED